MKENINELIKMRKKLQTVIGELIEILNNSPHYSDTVRLGGKNKTQKTRKSGKTRKSRK
jgi:hypothetical protein